MIRCLIDGGILWGNAVGNPVEVVFNPGDEVTFWVPPVIGEGPWAMCEKCKAMYRVRPRSY